MSRVFSRSGSSLVTPLLVLVKWINDKMKITKLYRRVSDYTANLTPPTLCLLALIRRDTHGRHECDGIAPRSGPAQA